MDIFVIHSGGDQAQVLKRLAQLKERHPGLNALLLESGSSPQPAEGAPQQEPRSEQVAPRHPLVKKLLSKFWWLEAERKIRRAQLVVFYVGEKSHTSPYIGWELKRAIRHNKTVCTIKLDPAFEDAHPALQVKDRFSRRLQRYDKVLTATDGRTGEDRLLEVIAGHESGDYGVFNAPLEELDKTLLLEQYKVFLQTSEDLVARRQTVNNFYISINSALVALFSASFAFDFPPLHRLVIALLFAAVGVVLSLSWIRLLASYGNLNSSKMRIISSIERQLPASLYDAEWAAMSDRLNKKRYVSFTESEKNIPRLFILLYAVIFILLLLSYLRG